MSKINCNCNGCANANFLPILQRINNCNCEICKRKNLFPFMYISCVEIHFSYYLNFDSEKIKKEIANIKQKYKREKKLVIYYFYFRYKLLKLLTEIQYRPGGSEYKKCMENFYKNARIFDIKNNKIC